MSKLRQIILISLLNITIMLWLSFIYSIVTHEEDSTLLNYESSKENSTDEPENEAINLEKK